MEMPIPMCGVPVQAAPAHLRAAYPAGHRAAIAGADRNSSRGKGGAAGPGRSWRRTSSAM